MGDACRTHGRDMKYIKILVGKPEGKRPFGRLRRRWKDNIRMGLRAVGWEGEDRMNLTQDREQCEHDNESSGSIKSGNFVTVSF
jgi:hypothetical protein